MYIAHIRKEDGKEQLLKDHLIQSAQLSGAWGKKLGLEKTCYLAGLLHDLGKYGDEFQTYLRQAVADPSSVVCGSVDHSTAGGKLLYDYCHVNQKDPSSLILAELIGNAIISHHSSRGLQDFFSPEGEAKSDYLVRVAEKEIEGYDQMTQRFFEEVISEADFQHNIDLAIAELRALFMRDGKGSMKPNTTFFLLKFVYSCLLDADRTNTMFFEAKQARTILKNKKYLQSYQQLLEEKVTSFKADTPINKLRGQMSIQCKSFAERSTGIYTLSIPTGGGKTLASLRFALNHALKYGKERIIYVAPFTTIIEQNAATVKDILKDGEHILEHHSNVFSEEGNSAEQEEVERKQALLKDNWEAPLIFTTMVQFLNTIYSKGTRNPRRFHNLTNAIIIFDETQGVPTKCTYLFNECLNFLKNYGHMTSVLCTATQPALEYVGRKVEKAEHGEMIANLAAVEQQFKRVEVIDKTKSETWSFTELADFAKDILTQKENLLMILNTKSAVLNLYHYLEEQELDVELYHLSTSMCAAHRKKILGEMREKMEKKQRILCVTTQLIEAGVDISFQAVIRSVAGLDSIAQAAGRCNRHGEDERQFVYLVNLSHHLEKLDKLPEIAQGKEITMQLLKERTERGNSTTDLLSHQRQTEYFKRYYQQFASILGYPVSGKSFQLFDLIGKNDNALLNYKRARGAIPMLAFKNSPKTVAAYFQVINSPTTPVLVPYGDEGKELIADLNGDLKPEAYALTLKKVQQFMVNLFKHEITRLQADGSIYLLLNGEILAIEKHAYSDKFGVDLSSLAENEAIIL